MKIAIIGPVYPFRGGIAQHTAMLANALQQAGHAVNIFSFLKQYPGWLYPGKSDREPGQNTIPVSADYLLDPLLPWTWWIAAKQILEKKPDFVIVIWWTTFWSLAYSSLVSILRKKGLKIEFLIHNILPHEQRFYDQFLTRMTLRQGDGFILQSEIECKRLLSLLPDAGPTIISPHPLYNQFLDNRLPKIEALKQLGLPDSDPIVLFFGIVRPYKGLKFLIDAIGRLHQEGIKVRLLVVGEFWEDIHVYQQQLIQLRISEQAVLISQYVPNEKVGLYFSAADIFVAPYIGGTQSGAVKIAISFGLPVVMTNTIVDEIIARQNENVYIVPPGDSKAISQAIIKLMSHISDHSPEPQITLADNSWQELARSVIQLAALNRRHI